MKFSIPLENFNPGGGSSLIFSSLLFWKTARKTTTKKKTRIFYRCQTPKILGKEGKNAQKSKEFLGKEKSGKSKGGLSKGGLGPKGANWAKKGPFGAISALPPWLWGAEELVPIGPEKAPIGPEKVPIWTEKARFRRKDFHPIFSENLGLKPPFVSPPLDFPQKKNKEIPKSEEKKLRVEGLFNLWALIGKRMACALLRSCDSSSLFCCPVMHVWYQVITTLARVLRGNTITLRIF